MSSPDYDYGEVLRRALHAAAESVEPSPEGLERIRERISPPPLLSFAMVAGWCSDLWARFTTWALPAAESMAEVFWTTVDRFRPAEPGHARSRYAWLRPAAAMGTAIFVVAAGAFAVMTLPQVISSSGSTSMPWSQHAASGGPGTSAVHSASQLASSSGSTGPGGIAGGGSSTTSSRCAQPGHSPSGTASPSPSTPGSSSPAASSSTPAPPATSSPPATTTSPSPSDTSSGTPDPGSETAPSPSTSASTVDSTVLGLVAGPAAAASEATREAVSIAAALAAPQSATKKPSPSATSPCPSGTPRKN